MDREALINGLITNSGWGEDTREFLDGLSDEHLQLCVNDAGSMADDDQDDMTPPVKKAAGQGVGKKGGAPAPSKGAPQSSNPTANHRAPTFNELLAQADPATREIIQNGRSVHAREHTRLSGIITNAKGNRFTKEMLATKSLGELEAIVDLIQNASDEPVQNQGFNRPLFFGAGNEPAQNQGPVTQKALRTPVMNFDSKGVATLEKAPEPAAAK